MEAELKRALLTGRMSFNYNSDLSGDVEVCLPREWVSEALNPGFTTEKRVAIPGRGQLRVAIPGEDLKAFVADVLGVRRVRFELMTPDELRAALSRLVMRLRDLRDNFGTEP
jgi:hypothetical protein